MTAMIEEPVIDPALPIIDAHHHLWFLPPATLDAMAQGTSISATALLPVFRAHARYLFDEFHRDVTSGHNIRASVFIDARAMYRQDGPTALRSVGEVEFVNGVAAMAASGAFGEPRLCAAIVGGVDLTLGEAAREVMLAHIAAGGGRYRGVRSAIVTDPDPAIMSSSVPADRMADPMFRAGFAQLQPLGLSFEAWLLEPQLPGLLDLARAFPETQIILNHVGAPVGVGRYAGQRESRFPLWKRAIGDLAGCPNVTVKLGGLGIPFGGFASYLASPPASSQQLAAEWAPYIEACIEAFGVDRCMFESNFPVDASIGSYRTLWNAFKRIAAEASADEKTALFSGTAARIYRIEI